MTRKWPWLLAVVLAGALNLAGCPGNDNGGVDDPDAPDGDPDTPAQPFLSINSTASFLQRNSVDLPNPQFGRSADMEAVLSNATATAITWEIQVEDGADRALAFEDDDGNFSVATTGSSVTVTAVDAPVADVSHDVIATAELSDGTTLTATIEIVVADDPIVGGDSTTLSVSPFPLPSVGVDANRQVVINPGVSGEIGQVSFEWNPVDPANLPAGITLGALDEEALELTIGDDVSGVFPFRLTVTDSLGNVATGVANVFLNVVELTVDVRAIRTQISPSAAITVRSIRAGGASDLDPDEDSAFIYFWQVLDETNTDISNTVTIDPPSGTTDDGNVIDWEFSGLAEGAYRFVLTVRDRIATEAVGSAQITLSDSLSVTVAGQDSRLGVDQGFTLRTARSGGELPFRYTFAVIDSNGDDVSGDTTLPAANTLFNGTTNDWAIGGFSTPGTYRFFVTTVDGTGDSATSSAAITVGDVLSLDVKANKTQVAPGDATPVTFTFDVNGGTGGYTYTYAISRSPGTTGAITVVPASPEAAAGDLGVTWAIPAAGAGATGTYRMDVTVEDALGNTAKDSLPIVVGAAGGGATLDLQTSRLEVAPGTTHTGALRSVRSGGVGPFTYAWEVLAPDGSNVTADFGTRPGPVIQTGSVAAAEITWTPDLDAGLTPGTYRLRLILTDTGTATTTSDTVELLVADILTVDLRPRASVIAPGVPIELTAVGNGGLGTYDFAFAVVDAEGDAAGTLSAAAVNNSATGTVVWAAPAGGSGTYRATVTATDDALGTTAIMTLPLFVTSNGLVSETIVNPPASQSDLTAVAGVFEPGFDFEAAGGAADSALSFEPATVDPGLGYARSLIFRFTDNDGGGELDVNEVEFVGTNQRGEPVVARSTNPAIGTDVELTVAFKTLERVTIDYTGAQNNDEIEVGIGQWIGLSAPYPAVSEAAADRSFHIVATGTTLNTTPAASTFVNPEGTGFETDFATPDAQLVRFPPASGNQPNGTRDYIIQFEPFTAMQVEVDADQTDLDVSDGDTATLTFTVIGGTAPYDFVYEDLGSLDADNGGAGAFGQASPRNNVLFVQTTYTPPTVAAVETHAIRVQVTDANGNVAVRSGLVIVRP